MKIYHNVRSSAPDIVPIEVNIDTVYIRSNWEWVQEEEFEGWNIGTEVQMPLKEYIESLADQASVNLIKLQNSTLVDRTDFLEDVLTELIVTVLE